MLQSKVVARGEEILAHIYMTAVGNSQVVFEKKKVHKEQRETLGRFDWTKICGQITELKYSVGFKGVSGSFSIPTVAAISQIPTCITHL